MLPNSFSFFGFLLAGAGIYYIVPARAKRAVLLCLSALFYWLSAPSFLWLLAAIILAGYGFGRWLPMAKRRRAVLALGLTALLGTLALFKYLGFFAALLSRPLMLLGLPCFTLPQLALPLGISFYIFVSAGYLIDVCRGKREAEKNLLDYSLFVGFFPAILSGPIERAGHLLPQLKAARAANIDDLRHASVRLTIGLAKKVLLADNLAILVNTAYADPAAFSGLQLMIAAIAYSFQIYYDFSAYSDMAIGAARLFGIELMENFNRPYFADSIKEFWRRWHISLSSWFRDYLYFPLGGSRKGKWRTELNLLIVFTLSGLWHGAATGFVVWGLLCGVYQVVGSLLLPLRQKACARLGIAHTPTALRVLITFGLTTISWVFFRAGSCTQAVEILGRIFSAAGACLPLDLRPLGLGTEKLWPLGICLVLAIGAEGCGLREKLMKTVWLRYALMVLLLLATAVFGAYGSGYSTQEFVYFQF